MKLRNAKLLNDGSIFVVESGAKALRTLLQRSSVSQFHQVSCLNSLYNLNLDLGND